MKKTQQRLFKTLILVTIAVLQLKAHAKVETTDTDGTPSKNQLVTKQLGHHQSVYHPDIEIYRLDIDLIHDTDRDGYFSQLSVEFDLDTVYNSAWLYAELSLYDGYQNYHYHTTDSFMIYGDSINDALTVETALDSGFAPNYYELSLHVYDAFTHELVALVNSHRDFTRDTLPLESAEYELNNPPLVIPQPPRVHSREFGGSASWWLFSLLILRLLRGGNGKAHKSETMH